MKHNVKITLIILAMFVAAQLIGIYVTGFYLPGNNIIPFGFDSGIKEEQKTTGFYVQFLTSLMISFAIAVALIFLLMRINSLWFIRGWFFFVIALSLGISINAFTSKLWLAFPGIMSIASPSAAALVLGGIFAYLKMFQRNIIVHNATELLVYPGIAAIFVGMLNLPTMIVLLFVISLYDIWAVWHSGVMQKMAKFQINNVKVFSGFFIPYASKEVKDKIKLLKIKYKENKIPDQVIKKQNIKINLAILGGGDVVFPIISAGVFLKVFGSIPAALTIAFFASLALLYLLAFSKKKKYYPAMPYLTAGILLGMLVGWMLFIM